MIKPANPDVLCNFRRNQISHRLPQPDSFPNFCRGNLNFPHREKSYPCTVFAFYLPGSCSETLRGNILATHGCQYGAHTENTFRVVPGMHLCQTVCPAQEIKSCTGFLPCKLFHRLAGIGVTGAADFHIRDREMRIALYRQPGHGQTILTGRYPFRTVVLEV